MKKIKNKKGKISLVFVSIFAFISALIPFKFASALDIWGPLLKVLQHLLYLILAFLLKAVLYITVWVFAIIGKFFNWMFNEGISITNLSVVNIGWGITRDVLNMFFIIAMLVIAFSTILRIESYQYKVLLPKLVYAALLVNFSRTIAVVMIDFSNVLMKTLLNIAPGGSIAETYAKVIFGESAMGINKTIDFGITYSTTMLENIVLAYFMMIVLIVALSIAILALAIMMLIRGLVLVVLIILSPAAFVLNILPVTKPHAQRWWDEFLKYVFYGPVAAFLIYLSILLAVGLKSEVKKNADTFIQGSTGLNGAVNMLSVSNITSILVIIVFLYMAVMMVQSLSPMAAGIATGLYKKAGRLGGTAAGWAGKGVLKAGGKRISRSFAKGEDGLPGGLAGLATGAIGAGIGALFGSRTGKDGKKSTAGQRAAAGYKRGKSLGGTAVSLLDPNTGKAAWDDLQADKDKRIYGKSGAKAKNLLKGIVDEGDKTDYERKMEDGLMSESAKRIKDENPALDTNMLMDKAMNSEKGSPDQKTAIKLLAEKGALGAVMKRFHESSGEEQSKIAETFFSDEYRKTKLSDGKIDLDMEVDILRNGLGEERALRELPNIAAARKAKGDYSLGTGTVYKDGKIQFIDKDEVAKQFGKSFESMTGDEQMKVKMASYADQTLDKGTGKFIPDVDEKRYAAMVNVGFSGDPKKVATRMPAKEREFLSANHEAQAKTNIHLKQSPAVEAKNQKMFDAVDQSAGKVVPEKASVAEKSSERSEADRLFEENQQRSREEKAMFKGVGSADDPNRK